jgi:enamine deaminase RidA (YjgF/YER057c/UK114 family)
MDAYEKLKELKIELPPVITPVAAFVPFTKSGKLVFVSGHVARKDGKPWVGKVKSQIKVEEAKEAARAVAIDVLGVLHAAAEDLNRVQRILKMTVFVNCDPDFTEPHLVGNGASELFLQVLGERVAHARTAIGVAQLPLGACVEIELIAELS